MYRLIILQLLICLFIKQNNARIIPRDTSFNTSANARAHQCNWLPCNAVGYPSSIFGYSVDCCTLQVPLNYAQQNQTINISMTRLTPNVSATVIKNTLFLLNGGPGDSGWSLFYTTPQLIPSSYGITIILPDHRGTGLSTLLSCDDNGSQNVTASCITYLTSKFGVTGLNQFSITSAAHDLSIQIQSYKASSPSLSRISIYGVSYGTFWLERFLLIYPNLVQSAAMDGLYHPLLSSDSRTNIGVAPISYEFLKYCEQQVECGQYFPVDQPPFIMLKNILQQMDLNNQMCVSNNLTEFNLTSEILRYLLYTSMVTADTYFVRTIIPAVIFRLNRCNADDVIILKYFFRVSLANLNPVPDPNNPPGFLFSKALQMNIILSETYLALNESYVSNSVILRWYNATVFAPQKPLQYNLLYPQWPKYPLDQYRFQISTYSPLLMLNGGLDAATITYQSEHLASITTPNRTFYEIPLAGHVTSTIAAVGYTCPLQLILSWLFPLVFPANWKDPSCIRNLPTSIDFVGVTEAVQQISMALFNISQPFGSNN
ncbi:unnamed protein product [Adineta steineri]|uniref:Uncharacterized protein n=3 Tax=Adineta steineri TaxID=433720 RepID=A0A818I5E0_9BILA|nr:unnamed protein product [Adineta steineri]CAF3518728.1 unnamed protein product [Adineta steineri]